VDAGSAAIALAKSFGIGIGVGGTVGLIGMLFLRSLKRSHYAYPSMLGTLLVLYVFVEEMGGSAALAILTAAVIVGNAPQLSNVVGLAKTASLGRGVENVHDQMTFIVKSFFFTFIGAMLSPPWGQIALGVFLGLILFVSRIPAVGAALIGSGLSRPAKGLVAVSMPRGMAAGVLAMVPSQAGMAGTDELPVVVFACVLTSILVFAVGFPILKKRLVAVDPSALLPPGATPALDPTASMSTSTFPPPAPDRAVIQREPEIHIEPERARVTIPEPEPPAASADATSPEAAIPLVKKD
jgi:cell volume regulation protein A